MRISDWSSDVCSSDLPAPIDIQIRGPKVDADFDYAKQLLIKIRYVNGVADARIQQSQRYPTLQLNMDRARAEQLGVTARNVTDSMLISLVGTSQVSPTFWLNPANSVSYPIVAQVPQYHLQTLSDLESLPVSSSNGGTQILGRDRKSTRLNSSH